MKYIFIAVILLAAMFFFLYESDKDETPSPQNTVQQDPDAQAPEENYLDEADEGNSDDESWDVSLRDVGTPCERHKYQMKPGTTETLTFTIKPDSDMDADSLQLSIKDNKMEQFAFDVTPEYAEIVTRTIEYPVWVVYADGLLADAKDHGTEVISFGVNNRYQVYFPDSESDRGLLTAGRNVADTAVELFGQKTEEEMVDILGSDDLSVEFKPKWDRTYRWQVVQEYATKKVDIAQASIQITTPDTINGFSTLYRAFGLSFVEGDGYYYISVSYNRNKKFYTIGGPGYDVDCP